MKQADLLHSITELEQHYRTPGKASANKVSSGLTTAMQSWLSRSPFFVFSTFSSDGIDCSPRGDTAGEAFRLLDETTIAIPDRRGNNRIDSLRNLFQDPRVGLLFLVPGIDEAIRVKGVASISINAALRQSFQTDKDDVPASVILVNVRSAFVQNARALRRSRLWFEDSHVERDALPDAAKLSSGPMKDT